MLPCPPLLDDPNRALSRAIAQAIGGPNLSRRAESDGHAHVESAALATVDELLTRIHRLKDALSDCDVSAERDPVAIRLILSDLALVVRLLRALNSDIAERLVTATNDLKRAATDGT